MFTTLAVLRHSVRVALGCSEMGSNSKVSSCAEANLRNLGASKDVTGNPPPVESGRLAQRAERNMDVQKVCARYYSTQHVTSSASHAKSTDSVRCIVKAVSNTSSYCLSRGLSRSYKRVNKRAARARTRKTLPLIYLSLSPLSYHAVAMQVETPPFWKCPHGKR